MWCAISSSAHDQTVYRYYISNLSWGFSSTWKIFPILLKFFFIFLLWRRFKPRKKRAVVSMFTEFYWTELLIFFNCFKNIILRAWSRIKSSCARFHCQCLLYLLYSRAKRSFYAAKKLHFDPFNLFTLYCGLSHTKNITF